MFDVKYKMSNLEQLVAENNYKAIETRMEAIDEQKSIINGVMLGEGEDCTRENFSFAGPPEINLGPSGDERWRAPTEYPVTLLFGRSAGGNERHGSGRRRQLQFYVRGLHRRSLPPPTAHGHT